MAKHAMVPEVGQWGGDFDGQRFRMKISNKAGEEIAFAMTPDQAAQMIVYFFRLPYDWVQQNPDQENRATPISVKTIAPVHGFGLAEGIDRQHATVLAGNGPLRIGLHVQTSKISNICETLHQATRAGFGEKPGGKPS